MTRVNLKHERNLGGGQRMRSRFEALVSRARRSRIRGRPALEDPLVRDRLAEILGYVRCSETMTLRQLSVQGPDSLPLEMPAADELRRRLEALGISDASHVVVYWGKDWVTPSTRVLLTCRSPRSAVISRRSFGSRTMTS